MERIIINREKNFTTVSNVYLKDKNLSVKAKGLLTIIWTFPDGWDLTINGLVAIMMEGRDSVRGIIRELIQKGYCKRDLLLDEKNRYNGYDYKFSQNAEYQSQVPQTENPTSGNPTSESPISGNPTQLNTKRINNLNNKKFNKKSRVGTTKVIPIGIEALISGYKEKFISDEKLIEYLLKKHSVEIEKILQIVDDISEEYIAKSTEAEYGDYINHIDNRIGYKEKIITKEKSGGAGRAMSL